jgi:hypothetical protein
MIDVSDEAVVLERRTGGGRFVLFCDTDLPVGCPLSWWSAMIDIGGDAYAVLIRLDEAHGDDGFTLLSLLRLSAARIDAEIKRAEISRKASPTLLDVRRHVQSALDAEFARRNGLREADEVFFDPVDDGFDAGGLPWLTAEFCGQALAFCRSSGGDNDEGATLEQVLLIAHQLAYDAAVALDDRRLHHIAVALELAVKTEADRAQTLRRFPALSGWIAMPLAVEVIQAPEPVSEGDGAMIGAVRINAVDHHVTLLPVTTTSGGGQAPADGHAERFQSLCDFEDHDRPFQTVGWNGRSYVCVITPFAA